MVFSGICITKVILRGLLLQHFVTNLNYIGHILIIHGVVWYNLRRAQ